MFGSGQTSSFLCFMPHALRSWNLMCLLILTICPEGIMGQIVRHWYKPNEQGFTLINTIICS